MREVARTSTGIWYESDNGGFFQMAYPPPASELPKMTAWQQLEWGLAFLRERYGRARAASLISDGVISGFSDELEPMASDHCGIVADVLVTQPRAAIGDMAGWSQRQILLELVQRSEDQMAAIDDLRAAVQNMQNAADAEHTELGAVVDQLTTVEGQLTQLQTQVSQGGGVSEADLAAVTGSIVGITQATQTAIDNAKANAAAAGGGGGGPAPTGAPAAPTAAPGTPTEPTAPAPTGTPADPTGGTPVAGSPTDPTTTAPTGVTVDERTVYTLTEDPAAIDPMTWPPAPVETNDDPPQRLYYFAGDTEPGQQNGAQVAGATVYTGATQPTVAGAAAEQSEAEEA